MSSNFYFVIMVISVFCIEWSFWWTSGEERRVLGLQLWED